MPINAPIAQPIQNRWVEGVCLGFKENPGGTSIRGHFRIKETGQVITKMFDMAINVNQINPLRMACRLPAIDNQNGDSVTLPEVGDSDLMGYDAPIGIFPVLSKGKYLNAEKFRPIAPESGEGTAPPGSDQPF